MSHTTPIRVVDPLTRALKLIPCGLAGDATATEPVPWGFDEWRGLVQIGYRLTFEIPCMFQDTHSAHMKVLHIVANVNEIPRKLVLVQNSEPLARTSR